jgi:hypothetical protein
MSRNPLDSRTRYRLKPILRYAAAVSLTPLFFLFALSYKFLHPNRAEECRAIVGDYKSLIGLKSGVDRNKRVGSESRFSKAA